MAQCCIECDVANSDFWDKHIAISFVYLECQLSPMRNKARSICEKDFGLEGL